MRIWNRVARTANRSIAKKIVAIIAIVQMAYSAMNMRDIYQKDMAAATTMGEENGRKKMTNNEAALILMRAETIVFGVPEAEYIKAVE